ncbi:hypothetical protein [Streptosporangium sp. NPDC051022]|uniref:hypothetical protein n=1 Tax=Streptosporangium sp. NPDC051022 TaxID=3155752 RepID=UPI00343C144C
MTPDDLIQSYVDDVARLLPRAQRRDVGYELRSLLTEQLAAEAEQAGRPADEAMATALVLGYGRPAETAARYRQPLILVDPADSHRFVRLAVIGVAVIWVLGLLDTLMQHPIASAGDLLGALGQWWTDSGVGALWWPGVLVAGFATAAWWRRARPGAVAWRPRRFGRDQVSRLGCLAAVVAGGVGLFLLFNGDVLLGSRAAPEAYRALAMDEGFLRERAPWLVAVMAGHFALYAVLIVRGRWQPLTRRIEIGLTLAACAVFGWVTLAGAMFAAEPADQIVKVVLVASIIVGLLDAARKLYRELHTEPYRPIT